MRSTTCLDRRWCRAAALAAGLLLLFPLHGCESCQPGTLIPELEVPEGAFKVDCVKLSGGAIGGDFYALHLKGSVKNLSPFRVELKGSYKGSDAAVYELFAAASNNYRPIEKLYLDPGAGVTGSIIYIKEQDYTNVPASIPQQTGPGFFRVEAFPVDENDQRLPEGGIKRYVVPVPAPEGFIADQYGKYQCPCLSTEACGEQTQPVVW
ncbi:MAG: hypothetical protein KDD47_15425 [Acidobacteria bacterium]|nr:hypothetical protein [Acidobacteriota bacterium]